MKTARKFKGSAFLLAMVIAILIAEVIGWEIATAYGVRTNPLVVGFVAAGLVAAIASVLYADAEIDE